jgi:type II secretion system protein G
MNDLSALGRLKFQFIAVSVALVSLSALSNANDAFGYCQEKSGSTIIQMKQLGVILNDFERVCGFYPTSKQGLDALTRKPDEPPFCERYDPEPFLKRIPRDAWNQPFEYSSDGKSYQLRSTQGYLLTNQTDEVSYPWDRRPGYERNRPFWNAVCIFLLIVPLVVLYLIRRKKVWKFSFLNVVELFVLTIGYLIWALICLIGTQDHC